MATINKKTGVISGKLGGNIYYDANGIQVVKDMPKGFISFNSSLVVEVKAITSELAGMWRELPEELKDLWEEYATSMGSASEVESNQAVSKGYCPIPKYPPRPRKMSGYHAFLGANAMGVHCGFGVRLYPPLDVRVPPAPMIDCKYERASGELVVWLDTPAISKPKKLAIYKAIIWLTAYRCAKGKALYLASQRKFDVFDIAPIAQRIEKRYSGIEHTQKGSDYKPFRFDSVPNLKVYVGAQLVMVPNELTAPIKSSGNWKDYWIVNQPKYSQFDGLKDVDYTKGVAIQKTASSEYLKRLEAKRHELAKNKFVKVL